MVCAEGHAVTIEFERQELRALALMPIRQLPEYVDDYTVNCRVGKAVAAHAALSPWNRGMQLTLENSLNERYPTNGLSSADSCDEIFSDGQANSHWYHYKAEQSANLAKRAIDAAQYASHKEDEKMWLNIAQDQIRGRVIKLFK